MGWRDRVWVTEEANAGGTFFRLPRAAVPDRERKSTASRMAAPADHPRIPLYFQPQLQTKNHIINILNTMTANKNDEIFSFNQKYYI